MVGLHEVFCCASIQRNSRFMRKIITRACPCTSVTFSTREKGVSLLLVQIKATLIREQWYVRGLHERSLRRHSEFLSGFDAGSILGVRTGVPHASSKKAKFLLRQQLLCGLGLRILARLQVPVHLPSPASHPDLKRDRVHVWKDNAGSSVACLGSRFMQLHCDFYHVNGSIIS